MPLRQHGLKVLGQGDVVAVLQDLAGRCSVREEHVLGRLKDLSDIDPLGDHPVAVSGRLLGGFVCRYCIPSEVAVAPWDEAGAAEAERQLVPVQIQQHADVVTGAL